MSTPEESTAGAADVGAAESSTAGTSTADTSTADTSTADTSTADTTAADASTADAPRRDVGRRGLLGAAGGALLGGAALGFGGGRASAGASILGVGTATTGADGTVDPLATAHPLRGEHQAGIVTPAQDCMFTAAFDVTAENLDAVRQLMGDWLVAAEQMCAGELVGGTPSANPYQVPRDTGEVWGYPPSSLTITVGVGGSLFRDADGNDRFGLASRSTAVLDAGMPTFGNEALRSGQSDGDIVVQACADDAQVAMHAIRNLTRLAFGTAALRWSQIGYGRTSSTSTAQETPRNLFGFKDGTNNMKAEDGADALAEHLWIAPEDDGGDWLSGGSYLALRKIRMQLEVWDRLQLREQEDVFGRDKQFGAPLSVEGAAEASAEFTAPDYEAEASGEPLIPVDAHIRLVSPENNGGARMLRRGYNYTDGNDSLGRIDGGLFFAAFVRDPTTGFYPILSTMSRSDALVEYIQHVGSGLFAILPGIADGDTMFGQRLFGTDG
ncbi:iron uptake transporter deferrochelatase/peroxidase subunit [Brachybacterium sp. DNPG3]